MAPRVSTRRSMTRFTTFPGVQDREVYKVVFLVGDAPPHMDYANEVRYPRTLEVAARKGIVVNTVQCGNDQTTTARWQQMASLGQGQFFQVGQSGDAVAIASPFDQRIAELSARLDATRLYYGDADTKKKQQRKLEAIRQVARNGVTRCTGAPRDVQCFQQRRTEPVRRPGSGRRHCLGKGRA